MNLEVEWPFSIHKTKMLSLGAGGDTEKGSSLTVVDNWK